METIDGLNLHDFEIVARAVKVRVLSNPDQHIAIGSGKHRITTIGHHQGNPAFPIRTLLVSQNLVLSVFLLEFFRVKALSTAYDGLAFQLDLVKREELGHFEGCDDVFVNESKLGAPVESLVDLID